jgi:CRISPR-associated protein Csc3
MPDFRFLEFPDDLDQHEEDVSRVLADYLKYIVNKKLRLYKQYLHTEGPKQGQSLFSHVMDLVTFVNRLTEVLGLTDEEQRCVYLALTVHDLNKIPEYGLGPGGRKLNYAGAATPENIRRELTRLEVNDFFLAWQDYLLDIVFLAHAHNASLTSTLTQFDQAYIDRTRLQGRLKGPLKQLMQAADTADNSHSSDHLDKHEVGIRDRLLTHVNGALGKAHRPYEYRFVLFDRRRPFEWSDRTLREVAQRIEQRLAAIQLKQLEQFVRSKPAAISVDAAALRSGASLQRIFEAVTLAVMRKQYGEQWRAERNTTIRDDLEAALAAPRPGSDLPTRLLALLYETDLLPGDEEALRRGEFAAAYRKFLDDFRLDLLKTLRVNAWTRIYRLFALPEAGEALYRCVHPYRRGYLLARDLPALSLDEMKQRALEDLADLEIEAQ